MINDFVESIKQAYYDLERSQARRQRMVMQNMDFGSPDPNMPPTPEGPGTQAGMGGQNPQPPPLLEVLASKKG